MLLWAELLRSVSLPTASLFPKKKDIANSSMRNPLDTKEGLSLLDLDDLLTYWSGELPLTPRRDNPFP